MSLWYSIIGYVNIKIEGLSVERFLNLIAQSDIKIWNVKRASRITLTASIKRRDFAKLQLLMRNQNMRLEVMQKKGTARHIKYLRMRNVFLLLIPIVFMLIYAYSSFIWVIDIKGVSNIYSEKIATSLENCGVRIGMPISEVDQDKFQRAILKENPELSWVGVNVIGVKLEITAVREDPPSSIVDKSTPSDIVANKDGIVMSIITYDGAAKVQKGSTFREGDVLIAGMIEHTVADPRYVCARGTIQAKIYYEATVNATEMNTKTRTGQIKTNKYVEIGNITTPIGDTNIDYDHYEIEVTKDIITDSFFIPLYYVKQEVHELELVDPSGEHTQEIRKQAEQLAYEKALSKVPKEEAEILGSRVDYSASENGDLLITVTIESLENVGVTVPIENIPEPTISPSSTILSEP